MNTYYELLNHLKTTFESDDDVSTVVTGDTSQIDVYRKKIFPLVHVLVTSSPFLPSTAVTRYLVEVTCVDIRDDNKTEVKDKFWYNDNRHDNWNLTRKILKTANLKLLKDHLNTDITLVDAIDASPVMYGYKNGLDGWQQTLTIDVPDDYTTICGTLEIESYTPLTSGTPISEVDITFNKDITLATGNVVFYDASDDTIVEDLDQFEMVVTNGNILRVTTTGGAFENVAAGTYYFTVDTGLVTSDDLSYKGDYSKTLTIVVT
jgi:hypothetical protein